MTPNRPPRLATWILTRVAGWNDALVGDLLEEYERRRSARWYWGQVLLAVLVYASRQVLLIVLAAALYVAGRLIAIPGTRNVLESLMTQRATGPGPWQLFTVFPFGGGQISWGTVFTLGISPYISAAFLVTIAEFVWSWLRRDAVHRRRLPVVRLTWCVAIVLSITEAAGFASFLERVSASGSIAIVASPGWRFETLALVTLTLGTTCLMLVSDLISKYQLGNGMLIVFVAGMLTALLRLAPPLLAGALDPFALTSVLLLNLAIAAAVSYGYQRAIAQEVIA
jgi:preprotein translocase subunit SecY